jgi:hypothetical protein
VDPTDIGTLLKRAKVPRLLEEGDRNTPLLLEQREEAGRHGQPRNSAADNCYSSKSSFFTSVQLPERPCQIMRADLLAIDRYAALKATDQIYSPGKTRNLAST